MQDVELLVAGLGAICVMGRLWLSRACSYVRQTPVQEVPLWNEGVDPSVGMTCRGHHVFRARPGRPKAFFMKDRATI
jgi:hypothetical protein